MLTMQLLLVYAKQIFFYAQIPIYWGNTDIALDFNIERLVKVDEFENFSAAVDAIRVLDEDSERWDQMVRQPWHTVEQEQNIQSSTLRVENFLDRIFYDAQGGVVRRGVGTFPDLVAKRQKNFWRKPPILEMLRVVARLAPLELRLLMRNRLSKLRSP